jgi:hypothetical protein
MKKILLVVMLLLPFISICPAYADGARITTEYEVEKNQKTSMVNDSFTVIPGHQITNTYISSIEFLMEGYQSHASIKAEMAVKCLAMI